MGFGDKLKEQVEAQKAAAAAKGEALRASTANCPGDHYMTEVNKGSINMGNWQTKLNGWYQRGYRLAHVFEQDGNTVQVFEHHIH
jgi:hypothetical protein